jgi:hypothetical protein
MNELLISKSNKLLSQLRVCLRETYTSMCVHDGEAANTSMKASQSKKFSMRKRNNEITLRFQSSSFRNVGKARTLGAISCWHDKVIVTIIDLKHVT